MSDIKFFIFFLLSSIIFSKNLRKTNILNNKRNLAASSNLLLEFPKCSTNDDCSNNGECQNGMCKCKKKYVTYIDLKKINKKYEETSEDIDGMLSSSVKMCNYKRKDQLTALMLSIFIGFGSEHFYMGNNDVGAGKFVFYIFCYFLNIGLFLFYMLFKNKRDLLKFIGLFEGIYMGMGFMFMFLWNLRDWIKIGLNHLEDSKGYHLYPW